MKTKGVGVNNIVTFEFVSRIEMKTFGSRP